ncbi:MAG: 1-(5-phosphoribosyl)-5-[(5-phosphoribosylamino)methylideneamino]imidazole-4-carboxamide isomerase [Deltaproteobacteria bacterium]|nr:1-(5-phosphoribosyl)-5-[(5-phosphoribosylamino)methylideneamino]imidazole-4-carboxamide isomerase [Deltaproteobacteria bacterium]
MVVIPAIDLKEGKCVRLAQGDFERVTVYSGDPVAVALTWQDTGAKRLHIIDLDGSRAGTPRNRELIRDILSHVSIPVQVGGGIRDMATVESYLAMGVTWTILGTAVLRDRSFVREACQRFPDRIILGIDATGGRVAVQGWTERTEESVLEVAMRYAPDKPAAIVYTDIHRDGMETGVNLEATGGLAEATRIPVIASGGVAGLGDIERLLPLEPCGVMGVIVGRAIYSGALNLGDALNLAGNLSCARLRF